MSKQLEEISFGPVDGPHKVVKSGDPDFEYIHRIFQHQVGLAEARTAEPSKRRGSMTEQDRSLGLIYYGGCKQFRSAIGLETCEWSEVPDPTQATANAGAKAVAAHVRAEQDGKIAALEAKVKSLESQLSEVALKSLSEMRGVVDSQEGSGEAFDLQGYIDHRKLGNRPVR